MCRIYALISNRPEYAFAPNMWSTVISRKAFLNHFMYHHVGAGGNFEL
ncbi:hypothetical protein HMPREF0083_06214 [Aneurinibacillus aneurinilyticus ATCC 12856]|jgi:hypothetical protein|uniref:Uncharacterized protein n=1 Tax=Aneurinibacillus aneurinilyticus ATCC 12856 TaxID=649747 RepID=U1XYU7_ANEAE|nr:hypothetical protein HMPREF0083_06214 [Aneurinibacillus aneurinilyticus ATCC 12856]